MGGTWGYWGSKTLALGFVMAPHYLRVLRSSLLFLCLKLVIRILRLIYFMIEITNLVMQHLLQNVILNMLDSEINQIRHLIKVQFVNKGIELINLPSLFILKIYLLSLLFLLILKISMHQLLIEPRHEISNNLTF